MEGNWLMYVYYGVLLVAGPVVLLLIERTVRRTERRRKSNVKEQAVMQPVETNSPIDTPLGQRRQEALENIGKRFSIIERMSFIAVILLWIFLLLLPQMGNISSTVFSILVGSSAVVVGIAARPFIENLISGIIISFSKPFRTGDTVLVDGKYGLVEDITLTFTMVKIWNWRRYIIPNSQMLTKTFINYTIKDNYQWMHVEFWVSYQADLEQVKQLAIAAARQSPNFAAHEEPTFWVMDLDKEGYKCWIAAWSNSPGEAWELGNDIRTRLLIDFRTYNIPTHTFLLQTNAPNASAPEYQPEVGPNPTPPPHYS